jgi:signal transduction histidine kinase
VTDPEQLRWPQRYAAALVLTAITVALSVALGPYLARAVFLLLWPAVILTALYAGLGPGLLVSTMGVVAIDYFLVPPRYSLVPNDPIEIVQLVVFMFGSTVVARMADNLRVSSVSLRSANAELGDANHLLQEQSVELEQTVEEAQALNEELEAINEELHVASLSEQAGRDRLEFMAHASEVLASSLDYETTLRQVAELAILRLADWCVVEINHPDGTRRSRAVAHCDPLRVKWADEIDRLYPTDPDAPTGAPAVLRTGKAELYPHVTDEMLEAGARDEEHLRLLRQVGFTGGIVVPIVARDRVLGTISFISAESGRIYTKDDLLLAEDLGRRAGAAVENAQLLRASQLGTARARSVQAFAIALNEAATLGEVAEISVAHGVQALGADAGSLALLVDDGAAFEIACSRGFADAVAAPGSRYPVTPGRPLSDAVIQGEPRIMATHAEVGAHEPSILSAFTASEMAAFAAIPLISGGTTLGGLSFSFRREQEFDDGARAFMLTLGEQAAQAIARARLLEAERAARTEAEAANRAKSEFLSAMSHELRTPLNAIGGYVDLIDMEIRGPVTEEQRADLARVRRAQQHLLTLINDILNFARIEAARIEYHIGPVPVGPLMRDLVALIEPQISAKRLAFECPACDSALVARADAERVRQVLLNLLANAVKFTAEGGIRVDAEADARSVRITVRDTGRGIPPDRLGSVFDPFVQLDRNLTPDGQQGVGLGLSISRELATAMSGTLTATSEPGHGSTFVLALPRG